MALTKVTGSVIKDNVSLSGNVSVGGTLTYQDVTNVDALGIGTFRTGIKVLAGQVDVGSNIKLGNAGVITATSFVGSGANLTGITQTTINNNANNRIITGSGTANTLEGEADLTFDGNDLTVNKTSGDSDIIIKTTTSGNPVLKLNASGAGGHDISHDRSSNSLIFNRTGSAERLRIASDGKVGINQTSPQRILHIGTSGTAEANIRIQGGSDYAEIRVKDSDNNLSFHHNVGGAGSRELFNSNGSTGHFSINCYSYQALTITTNENGTNGPELSLFHNSASPAASDSIAQIRFNAKDSAGNTDLYARIHANLSSPTSGSESGDLVFATRGSGTFAERLRITSTGQLLMGTPVNTGYNESAALISIAADTSAAANMLSDSSAIYNHTNPAFIHVQNRYNTGTGQEAGIIFHSRSSHNGSWAIYGKRTGSSYLSDLIFRNRTGGSSSTERLRLTSDGYLQQHKLIAVSYSDSREIALSNTELTRSNFYNTTNFESDSSILDSNGHFVAPVHGIYRLYFRCSTDGDVGNRANVRLRKNGNTINEAYANNNDSNDKMSVSSEIIMELDAGEYLDIQVGQLHTMSGNQHKVVNFHMLG